MVGAFPIVPDLAQLAPPPVLTVDQSVGGKVTGTNPSTNGKADVLAITTVVFAEGRDKHPFASVN